VSENGSGSESGSGSADERRRAAAERCRQRRERALSDGRCGRCFKRRPTPGSDLPGVARSHASPGAVAGCPLPRPGPKVSPRPSQAIRGRCHPVHLLTSI
jgi:hypothetical protein